MLTNLNVKRAGQRVTLAALLCGAAALSAIGVSQVSAQTDLPVAQLVSLESSAPTHTADAEARNAVERFVLSMSEGDAQAIWMFASEEEQEAFQTEDAVFAAFADAFPVLTQTKAISAASVTKEGDTPFVLVSLTDEQGSQYQANVGLWLDDAGDWKVISCDVTSTSDQIASL